MRHAFTERGEAHKAILTNLGKRASRMCWQMTFAGFNDFPIILCFVTVVRVWYFLFLYFMNECVTRKNKQISIILNKCSCIHLTGFLFCGKRHTFVQQNHFNREKNSSNRR